MPVVATKIKPSNSNVQGGIAGLAASAIVGALSHAGYLAGAAAFVGFPEASIALVLTIIVGTIVNVGVTHISELKNADEIIKTLQSVKTYQEYPEENTNKTETTTNITLCSGTK